MESDVEEEVVGGWVERDRETRGGGRDGRCRSICVLPARHALLDPHTHTHTDRRCYTSEAHKKWRCTLTAARHAAISFNHMRDHHRRTRPDRPARAVHRYTLMTRTHTAEMCSYRASTALLRYDHSITSGMPRKQHSEKRRAPHHFGGGGRAGCGTRVLYCRALVQE